MNPRIRKLIGIIEKIPTLVTSYSVVKYNAGVFEGDFQTKEEARAWLESRNLL
jgi:hypothetical protein